MARLDSSKSGTGSETSMDLDLSRRNRTSGKRDWAKVTVVCVQRGLGKWNARLGWA